VLHCVIAGLVTHQLAGPGRAGPEGGGGASALVRLHAAAALRGGLALAAAAAGPGRVARWAAAAAAAACARAGRAGQMEWI
jgi:hypothetical protein